VWVLAAACCTVAVFYLADAGEKAAPARGIGEGVPITERDLEQRLVRLGYLTAAESGDLAARRAAVRRFQEDHGLMVRGSVDASTEVYLRSLTQEIAPEPWMEQPWMEPPETE
jgi:hypothetical protein